MSEAKTPVSFKIKTCEPFQSDAVGTPNAHKVLIVKMINNIYTKVKYFDKKRKRSASALLSRVSRAYLQPHPQPPPQRQERMRISHTRSQLLPKPHPPQPVLPHPQPQLFKRSISRIRSQQLQPQPFEPPFAKKFIVCTSEIFRIAPTLPYAYLKKCVTCILRQIFKYSLW